MIKNKENRNAFEKVLQIIKIHRVVLIPFRLF